MSSVLTQAEQLFNAALELPVSTRAVLAERLITSLGKPPGIWSIDDPDFGAELDRRVAQLDSGKVQPVSWGEAKREINKMLNERRGN